MLAAAAIFGLANPALTSAASPCHVLSTGASPKFPELGRVTTDSHCACHLGHRQWESVVWTSRLWCSTRTVVDGLMDVLTL
jgi:hypothetical protein